MDASVWNAVLVAVIGSGLTGLAGLIGIMVSVRNGNRQRLQADKRATHDSAVGACQSAKDWIRYTIHTVEEMRLEQSNHEGGSQYALPSPTEFFDKSSFESMQVRSELYRVSLGNADEQTRKNANRLHFEMDTLEDQFKTAMQLADQDDRLESLLESLRGLQGPLRALEQSLVKAVAVEVRKSLGG